MQKFILFIVMTTILFPGCSTEPANRKISTGQENQRGLKIRFEDPPAIIKLPRLAFDPQEEKSLHLNAITKYQAKTNSYKIQVDVAYADSELSPEECARHISSRYVSANNIPEDEYDLSKTND